MARLERPPRRVRAVRPRQGAPCPRQDRRQAIVQGYRVRVFRPADNIFSVRRKFKHPHWGNCLPRDREDPTITGMTNPSRTSIYARPPKAPELAEWYLDPAPRQSVRPSTVAELLVVSRLTVYKLIKTGELQAHAISARGVRVYLDSVEEFQRRHVILSTADQRALRLAKRGPSLAQRARKLEEALEQLKRFGL
jgi:excisionase family DNA binding protein